MEILQVFSTGLNAPTNSLLLFNVTQSKIDDPASYHTSKSMPNATTNKLRGDAKTHIPNRESATWNYVGRRSCGSERWRDIKIHS